MLQNHSTTRVGGAVLWAVLVTAESPTTFIGRYMNWNDWMQRFRLTALTVFSLIGISLIGIGLLATNSTADRMTYSVQQLVRELHAHPQGWVGHIASVRGVAETYWWGSGHGVRAGHQTFLVDAPHSSSFVVFPYGTRRGQLNRAGAVASLLITGTNPQPSASKRWLVLLAHVPLVSTLVKTNPEGGPDTYRIEIVSTTPCPPAFGGFCLTGMTAP